MPKPRSIRFKQLSVADRRLCKPHLRNHGQPQVVVCHLYNIKYIALTLQFAPTDHFLRSHPLPVSARPTLFHLGRSSPFMLVTAVLGSFPDQQSRIVGDLGHIGWTRSIEFRRVRSGPADSDHKRSRALHALALRRRPRWCRCDAPPQSKGVISPHCEIGSGAFQAPFSSVRVSAPISEADQA